MVKKVKIVAIVQCRLGSIRFPKKVLSLIEGKPAINHLLTRLSRSKMITEVLTAIPKNKDNNILHRYLRDLNFRVFRGSEENVLKRYYEAAKSINAEVIIRITGDCPLVDYGMIDNLLLKFLKGDYDYLSNNNPPTYPDGFDVEIFKFKTLKETIKNAKSSYEKEHVTPFMQKSKKFKKINVFSKIDYSRYRLTLDEEEDLKLIRKIFKKFNKKSHFTYKEVVKFLIKNPKLVNLNKHLERNAGGNFSSGQKLWNKSKKIIPGGTMLFSKRPDLFLPNRWPTYYKKAKGCKIWDLNNKMYYDMSAGMGVGNSVCPGIF